MSRLVVSLAVAAAALSACGAPKGSGAPDAAPDASPSVGAAGGATGAAVPAPDSTAMPTPEPPASRPTPPNSARVPAPADEVLAPPIARPPAPGEGAAPAASPDVQELWSARTSDARRPARTVVRSAAEWARAAAPLAGVPQPSVDYATHMLVVAALGERPSAGYAVQVTGFERRGDGAAITVTTTSPGADCMTAQMITTPAVVARVPRVSGAVTFVERSARGRC
jgi:hypothetical protein